MEAHQKKIMAARTALILDQPFFGQLALRLKIVADPSCKTAWVDGRSLGYNTTFVESLSHAKLVALVAHEVMHCACGHPWRRDNRDKKRWNVAADHAINPILVNTGFTLPDCALLDPANEGKSAEWIYARQPQPQEGDDGEEQGEPEQGDDEQGKQGSDPSDEQDDDGDDESGAGSEGDEEQDDESDAEGDESEEGDDDSEGDDSSDSEQGEVRDAPADATEDGSTEADWNVAVQQAANAAAAQGKLPGELKRFADEAAETEVDWRSTLRRFVQETTAADYTWTQPSRRFLSRGLFMPSLHSEAMGTMVIAIDTSGSVDDVLLGQFSAEVRAIVDEANPARVHVIYCDAQVRRTDTFEREDLIDFESLEPVGGGGTNFAPVFEAVEELDEVPACIVYLTDLAGRFPTEIPEVPVLWATTAPLGTTTPFGEVLPIND